jgi:glycosyltransferase involved in cell wall biosynthesis
MAPLEAMAAGCPTIYSRVGSGPELITNGLDGLLVDPDSAEDIASALLNVLGDDSLARRLGEAARRTAGRRFGMTTLVPQNESLYRQCIDRFRRHTSATRWRWLRTA